MHRKKVLDSLPGTRLTNDYHHPGSRCHIDGTTGLPNHRAFLNELAGRLAKWKRYQKPLAVMLLNVDNFTQFNARFGKAAGDAVLRAQARAILGTMRLPGFLARSDEEAFALIVENEPLPEVQAAVGRLLAELPRNRIPFRGSLFQVKVSLGLAETVAGEAAAALLTRARAALEAAQNAGPARGCIHDGTRCLPIDPLFYKDESDPHCPAERRSCQRFPFEYVQLVGPYVEGQLPPLDTLHPVTCHDISAAGFSYRAQELPQSRSLVLVLGFASERKHMLAKVVDCRPLSGDQRPTYHVGCEFIGRIR